MTGHSIVAAGRFTVGMVLLWLLVEGVLFFFYYTTNGQKLKRYQRMRLNGERAQGTVEETLRKYNDNDGKGYYTYQITYSFCAEDGEWYYGQLTTEEKKFQQKNKISVYYDPENPQNNFTEYHLKSLKTENTYFGMFLGVVTAIFAVMTVSSIVFF